MRVSPPDGLELPLFPGDVLRSLETELGRRGNEDVGEALGQSAKAEEGHLLVDRFPSAGFDEEAVRGDGEVLVAGALLPVLVRLAPVPNRSGFVMDVD